MVVGIYDLSRTTRAISAVAEIFLLFIRQMTPRIHYITGTALVTT